MPLPMLAVLLLGAVAFLTAARMVWIRKKVREVRVLLLDVYGCSDDEETRRILRLEALYLAPLLGRIVRLNNLDVSRF
ncbi:hypothetical protein [Actinoallomurus sp. NPDC052274]|uniref:hypothetical protein n=1 Tax=Actinoallomurus sp. NPDC052274 TaxID=3155420 RepID=UPI00342621B2